MQGGGWTVQVVWVDNQRGAREGMEEEQRYNVPLPNGGETTVEEFIKAVNETKKGDRLTIFDLAPFDESVLGYQTQQGRRPIPNFVSKWVPTHANPRPVNCKWKPDTVDSNQKISDAGLCDGAELAFVKISEWEG